MLKGAVRKVVARVGLSGPAFKLLERLRARRALVVRELASDGLALPPPILMIRVVGHADPVSFEENGRLCAGTVRDFVSRSGRELDDMQAILDFGCGCGRVLRHWRDLAHTRVVGSDYNAELVEWCADNLPFAEARQNQGLPPLVASHGEFDLVYALSVFTHLTMSSQHAWMAEMRRVTKPGGLLFFTIKGDSHAEQQLDQPLLDRYRNDEFVATSTEAEGTNLCAAYASRRWVEANLLRDFELLEHHPGIPAVMDSQEIYLVRRSPAGGAARSLRNSRQLAP